MIEISQRVGALALLETVSVMLNTCDCTVRLIAMKRESPEKLLGQMMWMVERVRSGIKLNSTEWWDGQ